MKATIADAKVDKILALCRSFLAKKIFTICHVASLIGTNVSTFSRVELGPLHYRHLERDKDIALRGTLGDFKGLMSLSLESIADLNWWIVSLPSAHRSINHGVTDVTLTSDASLRVRVLLRGPLARMVCGLKLRQRTTLTCWNCWQ